MKERPILFSGPMVRALLDGSKTQTRRVLKQAVGPSLSVDCDDRGVAELSWLHGDGPGHDVHEHVKRVSCPYGAPGDRLWVRETAKCGYRSEQPPSDTGRIGVDFKAGGSIDRRYTLDERNDYPWFPSRSHNADGLIRWAPAIHMPRWASRITLEVTGVRVERLHDIGEADADAEGVDFLRHVPDADETLSARDLFWCLWDGLKPAAGSAWADNPWVWVVEFRRLTA